MASCTRRTVLLLLASVLFPATALEAAKIVNWGGNYVTTTTDLEGFNSFGTAPTAVDGDRVDNLPGDGTPDDFLEDDAIGGRTFSETTAFNPPSGYGGLPGGGLSETFYGGAITVHQDTTDVAEFGELEVQNKGPNDEIHVHLSEHGHVHDAQFVMYWDKADFLGGGASTDVSFDIASSVSVSLGAGSVENLDTATLRLLVRDDSNDWWASDTTFTDLKSNDVYTWNNFNQGLGGAADDGTWFPYFPNAPHPGLAPAGLTATPGSDLHLYSVVPGGGSPSSTELFTSITALGFMFDQDTFHNNLDFHIDGFSAILSVGGLPSLIPEPSTFALSTLGLCSLGMVGQRRRKR